MPQQSAKPGLLFADRYGQQQTSAIGEPLQAAVSRQKSLITILQTNHGTACNVRPFAFPKTRRLLNAQQVQGVFDNVDCKQGGKYFTLLSRSSEQAEARLGIIVAKRHIKTAVKRNAIKRRIRNTFRHAVGDEQASIAPFDVIVLAKADCARLRKQAISAELNRQWAKLFKKREALDKQ